MSSRPLLPLLAAAVLASVLAAGLLGCSGASGGRPDGPTPVLLRPTAAPVHEFVPGVHRYVGDSDRLVIPTPSPTPTPTRRPPPVFSSSGGGEPHPTLEAAPGGGDDRLPLTCTAEYRRSLVDYRGRIPFGAEVARDLAERLREARQDCAGDNWAPELSSSRVCFRASIAGVNVSPGLTGRASSVAIPVVLTSGRDDSGNILLHFARLPSRDDPGCWYYQASREAWAWIALGRDSGVDRRPFPGCDRRLRQLVSADDGPDFGPAAVARATDEVRLQVPSDCGSTLWNPFPSSHPHEDCASRSGTGIDEDGSLVITWHPGYPPSDYAVCWVLPAGTDVWDVYYVREEEGES